MVCGRFTEGSDIFVLQNFHIFCAQYEEKIIPNKKENIESKIKQFKIGNILLSID